MWPQFNKCCLDLPTYKNIKKNSKPKPYLTRQKPLNDRLYKKLKP